MSQIRYVILIFIFFIFQINISFSQKWLTQIEDSTGNSLSKPIGNKTMIIVVNNQLCRGCFNEINQKNNQLDLSGIAYSVSDLTNFLLNWRAGKFFSEIKIQKIEQQNHLIKFDLQAFL